MQLDQCCLEICNSFPDSYVGVAK